MGLAGTLVGLAGLAASVYLTYAHYTAAIVLACPESGLINCVKVTSSSYSRLLGVPMVLAGLAFFVVMAGLQLPGAWRSKRPTVRRSRLGLSAVGMIMVPWLVYVELFLLDAVCLWCTVVHVLTLVLFMLSVLGTAMTAEDDPDDDLDLDDDPEFEEGASGALLAMPGSPGR